MPHTPAEPALLPPAASHAAEAEQLAGRLTDYGSLLPPASTVTRDGFAALTYGLLAIASAVEAAGNDTSDVLADVASHLSGLGIGLEARLADLDATLGTVTEIAYGNRYRGAWRRWQWPGRARRKHLARLAAAGLARLAEGPGICDNASVGVIIGDGAGRYLVFDRAAPPAGVAPCAGHVFDAHGGFEEAARAEVAEELGLAATGLCLVTGGWRDNACHRAPGRLGTGHKWAVYQATASGEPRPSARETRNARWLTSCQLQDLAARTTDYARGLLSADEFTASPGIEPVWAQWLTDTGIIYLSPADLAAIDRLAAEEPTQRLEIAAAAPVGIRAGKSPGEPDCGRWELTEDGEFVELPER
jgi:8-oxo-dGTP pyrophosphatase MutT (NUDIX family)